MKPIKEQYKEIVCGFNDELTENLANRCTEIAEEFAIYFAEWLTNEKSKYSVMYGNQTKRFSTIEKDFTAKEVLEIYKKEKGL